MTNQNKTLDVEFVKDFLALQDSLPVIKRDKDTGDYSYASLENIWGVVKPLLKKHGFGILQPTVDLGGVIGVETILVHRSGVTISGTTPAARVDWKPWQVGSGITYARRYGAASLLNLVVESEDDDGKAAMGQSSKAAELNKSLGGKHGKEIHGGTGKEVGDRGRGSDSSEGGGNPPKQGAHETGNASDQKAGGGGSKNGKRSKPFV